MPQYGVNTSLNEKQLADMEKARALEGSSKYKFIRDAIIEKCEACLDGEKESVIRTSEESVESPSTDSGTDETEDSF